MKRVDMIKYVQASDVTDAMKAAAIMGISLMSKSDFERFSGLADRGLHMLEAKDWPGLMALLEEQDAPPEVLTMAKGMIGALSASGDPAPK